MPKSVLALLCFAALSPFAWAAAPGADQSLISAPEPDGRSAWDYGVAFPFRIYPLAGAFEGHLGYNHLFWGDRSDGRVWYGYVRPVAQLDTIGTTTRGELSVAIYPVSFVGLSVGQVESFRALGVPNAQCTGYVCTGVFGATYVQASLAFGAGPAFFVGSVQYTVFVPPSNAAPFVDDVSVLDGLAGGDHQLSLEGALGLNVADRWSTGFYAHSDRMAGTGSSNFLVSVFARYERGVWAVFGGVGAYDSSLKPAASPLGATFLGSVSWTPKRSFGLF